VTTWGKAKPEVPVPDSVNICGLTVNEQKVLERLTECHRAFLVLTPQHPDELREFVDAVHVIQGVLMQRIVRRSYPKGWPTYERRCKNECPDYSKT